jgi:murein DD-endopeptidase MepM/ murein hydrolase activator NlpD
VDQRRTLDAITPNRWPIRGHVGSTFGSRTDPFEGGSEMHYGLDIEAPLGAQVSAPASGVVKVAQRESEYGNLIVIDHGNGLTTRFAHLRGFAIKVGQNVTKGQLIGWVGMTGRTTGPHLHYEVRQDDRPINPRAYLRAD